MHRNSAIIVLIVVAATLATLLSIPFTESDGDVVIVDGSDNASMMSAMAQLDNGDELELTRDVYLTFDTEQPDNSAVGIITISKNITIDLNGFNVGWDFTGEPQYNFSPVIFLIDGCDVTLTGDGVVDAELGYTSSYAFNIINGGSLTVKSGTVRGAPTAIQVDSGSLTVEGGEFDLSQTVKGDAPEYAKYIVNCIDSSYKDGSANISLKGGIFGYDYSQSTEGDDETYLSPGYEVVGTDDGRFAVYPISSGEAEVDGLVFHTIGEAVSYVPRDGTEKVINLRQNITTSSVLFYKGQNILLNMGEWSIKSTGSSQYLLTNNATLNIIGPGSITASDANTYAIYNNKTGDLTIDQIVNVSGGYSGTVYNTGTMMLASCTVESEKSAVQTYSGSSTTISYGASIITTSDTGSFAAVVNNSGAEMTIDDAYITGVSVGISNSGDLTFKTGMVTVSGTCVRTSATSGITAVTRIIDGTFTNSSGPCIEGSGSGSLTIELTGGTYSSSDNLEGYLAEGYRVYENENGTYCVQAYRTLTFYNDDRDIIRTIEIRDLDIPNPEDIPILYRDGYLLSWENDEGIWSAYSQVYKDVELAPVWVPIVDGIISVEGEAYMGQTVELSVPDDYYMYLWIRTDSDYLDLTFPPDGGVEGTDLTSFEATETGYYWFLGGPDSSSLKDFRACVVYIEFTESPTVTVTFNDENGNLIETQNIVPGSVPDYPDLPSLPDGYDYLFNGELWSGDPVTDNTAFTVVPHITDFSVRIDVSSTSGDRPVLVAIIETDVAYETARFLWTMDLMEVLSTTDTVTVEGSGTYYLGASIVDSDGIIGEYITHFTYTAPVDGGDSITADSPSVEITTGSGGTFIPTGEGQASSQIGIVFNDDNDEKIAGVEISGSAGSGGVLVSLSEMDRGSVTASIGGSVSDEYLAYSKGVDVKVSNVYDYMMVLKIPVQSPEGLNLGSANAYFIENDGSLTPVDCIVRGGEVWIYTTHNTEYVVTPTSFSSTVTWEDEPTFEEEPELPPFIPFPPQQGGDPIEVWPSENGSSATGGADDTLKVVACAAAVVIATMLIIIWASTYRNN